jgi:hypothetical protein
MLSDPEYIGSRQVKRRYGDVSDMALWRWLHNPKVNFPKPTIINRRRYWRVAELEAWERRRAARGAAS